VRTLRHERRGLSAWPEGRSALQFEASLLRNRLDREDQEKLGESEEP